MRFGTQAWMNAIGEMCFGAMSRRYEAIRDEGWGLPGEAEEGII